MEVDDAFGINLSDSLPTDNVVLRHVLEILSSTAATYHTSVHSSMAVPNTRIDECIEFDNDDFEHEVALENTAKYSAETSGRDQLGDGIAPKRKQIRKNKSRGHGVSRQGGNHGRHRDRQGTPRPSRTTPD